LNQLCLRAPPNGRYYNSDQDSPRPKWGSQPAWPHLPPAPIVLSLPCPQLVSLPFRFATMDNFCPKVFLYSDNRSSGSSDNFSKTQSSDFEKRRKAHYNEGKFLKAPKNLPLDNNKNSSVGSVSMSSGSRGVMLASEPRPVERGGARGLTGGVKDEALLADREVVLEASPALRNQSPASSTTVVLEKEIDLRRKEYCSKGRYLRCSPHPELEEDTEDEQQTSESWAGSAWERGDETLQLQWTQEEEARQWKL
uniref:Uncharacterized protein n=1 Tax=Balaenoptera musculus TaxID=9771 RepID=A0A8C0E2I0_BALMU